MGESQVDAEQFAILFTTYAPRVRGYARRHGDAATADDIVSETFLVAWRRRADLPDEPLPWLLVVARNALASRWRSQRRVDRLRAGQASVEELVAAEPGVDGVVVERSVMIAALASLTAVEREAVLLIAWDGLSSTDAAVVAGCSVRAFTVRLHRARQRLARALDLADDPDPHGESRRRAPSVTVTTLDHLLKEPS